MSVTMNAESPALLRISISPEPSDDERDAIVAALLIRAMRRDRPEPELVRHGSRWVDAGRLEAMHARSDRERTGRGWNDSKR